MRSSGISCVDDAPARKGPFYRRRAPLCGVPLILFALICGCSHPRLQPPDAQRMIESHPRFQAPQLLRLPARYCAARPGTTPPPLPPTDPAYTPPQDVNHINALQAAGVIEVAHRPAAVNECHDPNRDLFIVTLTRVGENFRPAKIDAPDGWRFVLAERKFVKVEGITYDDPDDPKLAHVQYVWTWVPTLLGQLLQIGSVPQGASATFLRDGSGWIVRQPGM